MKRYSEAETFYRRGLAILEKALGPSHAEIAIVLFRMAESYRAQKLYNDVEPLFERAAAMMAKTLGSEHPMVGRTLSSNAQLLRAMKRKDEAAALEQRANSTASNRRQQSAVGVLTVDYGDLRNSIRERGNR
jgi:tetratricopeptide (TPR) repeat protein